MSRILYVVYDCQKSTTETYVDFQTAERVCVNCSMSHNRREDLITREDPNSPWKIGKITREGNVWFISESRQVIYYIQPITVEPITT